MRIDLFLVGYAFYRVPHTAAVPLFQTLQGEQISPKRMRRNMRDGEVIFLLSTREGIRFERVAKQLKIPFLCEKKGGVPLVLRNLLHCPGIIVGIFLALVLFLAAQLVVWDVRIEGNVALEASELESDLASCGVYRGGFWPFLDTDAAALALRQKNDRVAYAALNRVGTVLYVQIKEAQSVPPRVEKKPANLVAKYDGVVTMPLVFEGECLVQEGDVVRKGQILVGGLIDTQNHGYRVTRAAGQVLARTVRTYTVQVPFVFEEKAYTEESKWEISLIFFHWTQKVFKSTGNYIDKCDIIEKTEWGTLPTGEKLPVACRVLRVMPYKLVQKTRSEAQARAKAEADLSSLLEGECKDRAMLQKSIAFDVDEHGVTLTCTVVYEEDIAAVAEFTLQP